MLEMTCKIRASHVTHLYELEKGIIYIYNGIQPHKCEPLDPWPINESQNAISMVIEAYVSKVFLLVVEQCVQLR